MSSPIASYQCKCGKACAAPIDSRLALLKLCQACCEERIRVGLEAQRKADGNG
jgi:hypothetical protein